MRTEIRLTEDASHTLYVAEIDECYHSIHGAVRESAHIFVDAGLRAFLSSREKERDGDAEINVLEIGFGTGLNAYLTFLEAEKVKKRVHYTALELYPLAIDEAMSLHYPEMFEDESGVFEKIHLSRWGEDSDITPGFTLCKMNVDFTACELPGLFDVVYFDAFSPDKQPEMWSEEGFRKIGEHTADGAVLTTYCAKGAVRRSMQSAGFVVERLPGPPGKREILRGRVDYTRPDVIILDGGR
ncbi:MAG: tRNA (5-methylaminomethyl-2-thiouridine)(34)-methyltransferase MnmD [Tannerella sp.]|nr:tRNA (5-methylaminomethyl-2-thiouridine)(34)-methyltransferase MnmD [Tannerella sp.]